MDTNTYEQIVAKYIDSLYRIAISHTGNASDADDMVQQTFFKLLAGKVNFTDEEHMKRWLIRVCINECNSMFSSFWRRNVKLFAPNEEKEYADGQIAFMKRENRDLYEAVMMLPKKCRVVVYLYYYEGYSTKEIEEIIHVKEATIRTRLVRARKLLKETLKEAWEYDE